VQFAIGELERLLRVRAAANRTRLPFKDSGYALSSDAPSSVSRAFFEFPCHLLRYLDPPPTREPRLDFPQEAGRALTLLSGHRCESPTTLLNAPPSLLV